MTDTSVMVDLLRRFSPFNSLRRDTLVALSRQVSSGRLRGDEALFQLGDTERRTYYLVSGALELVDANQDVRLVAAGTDEARHAIAPILPRRFTAIAVDTVEYLTLDTDRLDTVVTWDQTGRYDVAEVGTDSSAASGSEAGTGTHDWMLALLQSKAFHRVPPVNLQAMFLRMQQVRFKAGDTVIRQGDEGDYFYVITSGRCIVAREGPAGGKSITLAELGAGDTFGEEAIVAQDRRNASVMMQADGMLMRLSRHDFNALLKEPMLSWVDRPAAHQIVADGGRWLDVRLPTEFSAGHEPDAINIPVHLLRMKSGSLDTKTPYVVCCDTGRRSSAGAYILSERGYDASALRGGLNSAS